MKRTKFFLLTIFLAVIKFGQAQTGMTDMVVYPNPFSCVATIKFDLATNDTVSLNVYTINGQVIRTFFSNTPLPSGSYLINFFGDSIPNGIYIVRFAYGDSQQINKQLVRIDGCSTTSISETTSQSKNFSLFPNPTNNFLTIPIDELKTILITNLNGQICKTVRTQEKMISLFDLPTGNYFVSVFSQDNKLLTTCKIVKTN